MKAAVEKYGWGTIIGLQLILGAMALFCLMLALGSVNMVLLEGNYLGAVLVAACTAGLGWPTFFLLCRFYRVLAGEEPDPPNAKPANANWATGVLRDPQVGKVVLPLIVLAAFVGGGTFVGIHNAGKIAYNIKYNGIPWLFVGFMGLMMLTLVNWIVKLTVSWLRYGEGELKLSHGPGRLGERFEAQFIVPGKTRIKSGLRAELTCHLYDFRHRRTDHEGHTADLLWWHAVDIDADKVGRAIGKTLPIRFNIPADLPPSGIDDLSREAEWTLQITSEAGALDMVHFQWTVPVLEPGVSIETAIRTPRRVRT